MNNKFIITIPRTVTIPPSTEPPVTLTVHLLLTPYYISEFDILKIYYEEESFGKFYEPMRDLIFKCSLKADELFYNKLSYMDPKEVLFWKKHITECLVVQEYTKRFSKEYYSSNSRSKSFADFSVSTTIKNDPTFLASLLEDSAACILEIKGLVSLAEEVGLNGGLTNLRGSLNFDNSSALQSRLWWHSELSVPSTSDFANKKVFHRNRLYKDGVPSHVSITGAIASRGDERAFIHR